METEYNENNDVESISASSECFSLSDSTDDSDEELGSDYESQKNIIRKRTSTHIDIKNEGRKSPVNIVRKLLNREHTGNFSKPQRCHLSQRAFETVPTRLSFCLKDIVPGCFLHGHMFMGLTACGQFLLSYKVSCNDNAETIQYSFNLTYKYTLYFWIFKPHQRLSSFYKCCLFDDHGVDNIKEVTITQWKHANPRVLIVHGAAEDENEDSYITYVKVPKLGCLDCKKLRAVDDLHVAHIFSWHTLCLKCNLTIHTKYSTTDSDRKFNSYTNLICPDRILIVSNGFLHMLHIDLDIPSVSPSPTIPSPNHSQNSLIQPLLSAPPKTIPLTDSTSYERRNAQLVEDTSNCDNHNNIVARIIADFTDIETDSPRSNPSRGPNETECVIQINEAKSENLTCISRKTYDELIFTCNGSTSSTTGSQIITLNGDQTVSGSSKVSAVPTKVSLIKHRGKRHHRIVTKSYRNGITTVDVQAGNSSSNSANMDKSNAYEFSEDNEKCEKISTLRKRRLAEKKYEFSEDNSENIIPFMKIRSANRSAASALFGNASGSGQSMRGIHRPSPTSSFFQNSPCGSPSSSPRATYTSSPNYDSRHCTPSPILHRASPIALQQDFRSPPPSTSVAMGIIRSPSRTMTQMYSPRNSMPALTPATQHMLSFKSLGTLSPLQMSITKRNYFDLGGSMSPNGSVPFLSPRREEYHRVVEVPLQSNTMPEKPVCTKKFKRRYIEMDDAASVITSEEDDCISPGYHTSLPMEVHGSCYSDMQMISQTSYQQFRCASVVITQHSFDLEAFTYYVIGVLCQKNCKTYDVFFDWASEIINVCPHSYTITCVLMAQFSARDQLPTAPTNCLNCSNKIDCAFHRSHFECRILFTWNMESGDWEVLDYGELMETKFNDILSPIMRSKTSTVTLAKRTKKFAHELATNVNKMYNYEKTLRVLDSTMKKSKRFITDTDNLIEFYLKNPHES